MIVVSLIIIAFIAYVLYNTKIEGNRPANEVYWICIPGIFSVWSALAILVLALVYIYKFYKLGDMRTLSWIENIYDKC